MRSGFMNARSLLAVVAGVVVLRALPAQSVGPDVIVGDLNGIATYAVSGGIAPYAPRGADPLPSGSRRKALRGF